MRRGEEKDEEQKDIYSPRPLEPALVTGGAWLRLRCSHRLRALTDGHDWMHGLFTATTVAEELPKGQFCLLYGIGTRRSETLLWVLWGETSSVEACWRGEVFVFEPVSQWPSRL